MIALLPLVAALGTFAVAAGLLQRRAAAVDPRRRIAAYVEPRRVVVADQPETDTDGTRLQVTLRAVERRLARTPGWAHYEQLVERADFRLRPVELLAAVAGGALVLWLLLLAAHVSLASIVLLSALGLLGLRAALSIRISRRRRAFEEQLPELLVSIASSLRAGHGFNQALQAVANDAAEPAHKELQRVLSEARLGRPLEDALNALGDRIGSADLRFVLDAVVVQRQVGGSLAGIFGIVGETVRQRQQFGVRLRALTAMGRTSALVLLGLPFGIGFVLMLLNRSYLTPLVATSTGRTMLIVSGMAMVVGAVWLRRIVTVKG